jgi:predicted glutamine amidotransferase
MCRWLAYSGQPIRPDLLLYETSHSLIEQSRHARLGVETFNGDGFGLGWYDGSDAPAVYRTTNPAWSDRNLRDLAAHVTSQLFLAHVRATTGTAVQQTNCHPFRSGRWLFVHNGAIAGYERIRRDLLAAVDPSRFAAIEGSTDSEAMFFLALSFGLDEDPLGALERMAGFVEAVGHAAGVDAPLQMTVAVSDGERIYAARYSSAGTPRTLFTSTDAHTLRQLHPESDRLRHLRDEDRVIVSEPLVDLPAAWQEIPPSTAITVQPGPDETRAFVPQAP